MTNQEIQEKILFGWNARPSHPRVGDFVRLLDGTLRRFTYAWARGLQTTMPPDGDWGRESFHIDPYFPRASYSGGLDDIVPNDKLVLTDETRPGVFWHWNEGISGAGRAVDFTLPCRVYVEVP